MSFYPAKGGGDSKLEDHYYIGNWADTNGGRGDIVTITVPSSIRNNKPIKYAFASCTDSSDGSTLNSTSKDVMIAQSERSCKITGDGTFTIDTTRNSLSTNYQPRYSAGAYIVFF